jgi:hypothetical protein
MEQARLQHARLPTSSATGNRIEDRRIFTTFNTMDSNTYHALMRTSIAAALLIFLALPVQSQTGGYKTLGELGWNMTNFSMPDQLTEIDTGYVDYLVTLSRKGKVTRLKILRSSFGDETEKLWRQSIIKSSFTPRDGREPRKYKGTLSIERAYCSSEPNATEKQIDTFKLKQKE